MLGGGLGGAGVFNVGSIVAMPVELVLLHCAAVVPNFSHPDFNSKLKKIIVLFPYSILSVSRVHYISVWRF